MANATRDPSPVHLELTEDEAQTLYRLVGSHITGSGTHRDNTSSIFHALSFVLEVACESLPTSAGHYSIDLI